MNDLDLLVAGAMVTFLSVAGASMGYDPWAGCFLPKDFPPGIHAAGRVVGLDNLEAIEAQGKD